MIYLGADHRGFLLKEKIKESLRSLDINVTDLGANSIVPDDDYPLISFKVAESVVKKHGDLGILCCGSGAGACLSANKVCGARATIGFSPRQIDAARIEDNVNILCLSANHIDDDTNTKIVETFINSHFAGEERQIRRLKQIQEYESKAC